MNKDLLRLAQRVANLNPNAGEIGEGMLRSLVEDANKVICEYQSVALEGFPPLPEWSKRDDLGGLVPSEIRQSLRQYGQQCRDTAPVSVKVPDRTTREAEQRARMERRFAGRAGTTATEDFDLPAASDDAIAATQDAGEVVDGEWDLLAIVLCEEDGNDPHQLLWSGGPIPEPWGDYWCKYEGDAKRMIRLVREFAPASGSTHPAAAGVPEGWREAVQEFCDRVEAGEISSKRTYAKFKELLSATPTPQPVAQGVDEEVFKEIRRDLSRIENFLEHAKAPSSIQILTIEIRCMIDEIRAALNKDKNK